MEMKDIGRRVHILRKNRGFTMRQLADMTGLSQGQISRLENGRQGFRSETLIRMANALGVEPYRLYLPDAKDEPRPSAGRLSSPESGQAGSGSPAVGGRLAEALRQPYFVALLEDMAEAYRDSPEQFRAIESVTGLILGDAGASSSR